MYSQERNLEYLQERHTECRNFQVVAVSCCMTDKKSMQQPDLCYLLQEASIAWRKRQAQIRDRENAERQRALWQMWEPAAGSKAGQTPLYGIKCKCLAI